jgi:aminoglycoside phosphotransferase (APT) family kinase protein
VTDARFSPAAVAQALGDAAVASVEVEQTFVATATRVARISVQFSDGRAAQRMIGKSARGPGIAAARRELEFFADLAPLWDSRAPALLGACEHGAGDDARLLLLIEDLGATGHTLVGAEISAAQLDGAIDALVALHARFWDAIPPAYLDPARAQPSVTQSAQAWPPELIARHAAAARVAAAEFLVAHGAALEPGDRALLDEILAAWEPQLAARVAGARALTLIHADFHFFGNVLFASGDPRPRIIDWSELKPGLGPHDVAYGLIGAPSDDRATRDAALLRRYWDGLAAAGVDGYSWELCRWDHRFSLITNVLQALLQGSALWFSRTAAVIDALDCRAALRDRPPV